MGIPSKPPICPTRLHRVGAKPSPPLLKNSIAPCVCTFPTELDQGMSPEEAFRESCESITGPITKTISKHGVLKLYNDLSPADKKVRLLLQLLSKTLV